LLSKLIAHGQLLRILGLIKFVTKPLMRKRMILETRNIHLTTLTPKNQMRAFSIPKRVPAEESLRMPSSLVKNAPNQCLGMKLILLLSLLTGTGETSTTLTIFHGAETSTFLSIAVHAGLTLQHQLSLTVLRFAEMLNSQILAFLRRLLFHAQ